MSNKISYNINKSNNKGFNDNNVIDKTNNNKIKDNQNNKAIVNNYSKKYKIKTKNYKNKEKIYINQISFLEKKLKKF